MNSEEIIERLLEEKHITVKEAMVLLKELARESVTRMFYLSNDRIFRSDTYGSTCINTAADTGSSAISASCTACNKTYYKYD